MIRVKIVFISLFLFISKGFAETFFLELNSSQSIEVEKVNEVRVFLPSECKKNCLAINKASITDPKKLKKLNSAQYKDRFNPALIVCESMEGKLDTLYDSTQNAQSICRFSDGSFLFPWDYFERQEKIHQRSRKN